MKRLSTSCKKAEIEAIDIVCPVLASMTYSLYTISGSLTDSYQEFGRISPEFQKVENPLKYLDDLFSNVIFEDPEFESVKARMNKVEDRSFVNFFNMRAKNRRREMQEVFRSIDNSRLESMEMINERDASSDNNMVPMMSIGTISNRSGTFTSPGASIHLGVEKKGGMGEMEENKIKRLKNPPIRSPSKSGRDSDVISVER